MTDPDPAAALDGWLEETLGAGDPVLGEVLRRSAAAGLPDIAVSPLQGRLLGLLVAMCGARAVLEIGTLGGYSSICLARGGARVTSLELDPHHAEVARANLAAAGLADRVEVLVGPAADSLASLRAAGAGPYDLVFVDADKRNSPTYVREALAMSRPGTVVVVDNVVRRGRLLDASDRTADVVGTRQVLADLGADDRLEVTAVQTVGSKGWDGFALARVR